MGGNGQLQKQFFQQVCQACRLQQPRQKDIIKQVEGLESRILDMVCAVWIRKDPSLSPNQFLVPTRYKLIFHSTHPTCLFHVIFFSHESESYKCETHLCACNVACNPYIKYNIYLFIYLFIFVFCSFFFFGFFFFFFLKKYGSPCRVY